MSRRIASWAIACGALAAATVLIAAPAKADRECFENSCRMPDVVEPPPPVAQRSETDNAATAHAEAAHGAEAARAQAPAGIYPQMVVDPALRKPVKPAPRRGVNTDVGPPRFPTPPAPRYPKAAPAPVTATGEAPAAPRAKPLPAPAPAYTASESSAAAGAVIARAPGVIHVEAGVAPAYAILRPDPAWKVCQIEQRGRGDRYYHCGPYSYHPYGAHGYRPYGTYRAYRSAPAYVLAPNAKIISIDTDD